MRDNWIKCLSISGSDNCDELWEANTGYSVGFHRSLLKVTTYPTGASLRYHTNASTVLSEHKLAHLD